MSEEPRYLEIRLGQRRKWMGRVGYAAIFLGVAAVLVALFVEVGVGLKLAIPLVVFMMVFMVTMGAMAGRRLQDRDGRRN